LTSKIVQLKSEEIWDCSPWASHLVVLLCLCEELDISFLETEKYKIEQHQLHIMTLLCVS